ACWRLADGTSVSIQLYEFTSADGATRAFEREIAQQSWLRWAGVSTVKGTRDGRAFLAPAGSYPGVMGEGIGHRGRYEWEIAVWQPGSGSLRRIENLVRQQYDRLP